MMVAQRKTPCPSNASPPFAGNSVLEAINTEITALWQFACVPLTAVAGVNVITASCVVPIPANLFGNEFQFLPAAPNTGNVTLQVDGRGALPVRDAGGNELPAGYLSASRIEKVRNFGTEFRLTMTPTTAAPALLRTVFAFTKARGVDGGVSAGGSARTRYPFNTIVMNNIPGMSLDTSTNIGRMTLPARSFVSVRAEIYLDTNNACGLYLYNVSDAADQPNMWRRQSQNYSGCPIVEGAFTLTSTKQMDLQYAAVSSGASVALGRNVSDAGLASEMYGFIEFTGY